MCAVVFGSHHDLLLAVLLEEGEKQEEALVAWAHHVPLEEAETQCGASGNRGRRVTSAELSGFQDIPLRAR